MDVVVVAVVLEVGFVAETSVVARAVAEAANQQQLSRMSSSTAQDDGCCCCCTVLLASVLFAIILNLECSVLSVLHSVY